MILSLRSGREARFLGWASFRVQLEVANAHADRHAERMNGRGRKFRVFRVFIVSAAANRSSEVEGTLGRVGRDH